MILTAQVERSIFRKRVARFGDTTVLAEDKSRHDQRLCPGAALDETALDQQEVGPFFGHQAVCWVFWAPSAESAVVTICGALSPASSYCTSGRL